MPGLHLNAVTATTVGPGKAKSPVGAHYAAACRTYPQLSREAGA